jgi:hypothetical protein
MRLVQGARDAPAPALGTYIEDLSCVDDRSFLIVPYCSPLRNAKRSYLDSSSQRDCNSYVPSLLWTSCAHRLALEVGMTLRSGVMGLSDSSSSASAEMDVAEIMGKVGSVSLDASSSDDDFPVVLLPEARETTYFL